ncbi:MAG: RluA family pseudouridine synthase [Candidatus Kapaibacterium sp.]
MSENNENIKDNYPDYIEKIFEFEITPGQRPLRLDVYLTSAILNASRTKVQRAISEGMVTINGQPARANRKIRPGDRIVCKLLKPPPIELVPEDIPLDIYYEDEHLMVVNKPAGMCSHPGFGNRFGTLVNALLWHFGRRDSIALDFDDEDESDASEGEVYASEDVRPGIVHRLDKDTSGLLVIAKNSTIHAKLADQFAMRTTEREYNAVVWGTPDPPEGRITGDIGRSPRDRKLFAVVRRDGKFAATNYSVIESWPYNSLIKLRLETGRTHQIRVHCQHIGHPVFGDPDYAGASIIRGGNNPQFRAAAHKALKIASRQMLHAKSLGFTHPVSNDFLRFESELPEDMLSVIDLLGI